MTDLPAAQASPPTDSLRLVLDSVFAGPEYRWLPEFDPLAPLRRWWLALVDWLSGLSERAPGLYWVLVGALSVALVAILVHAIWILTRTLRSAGAPPVARSAPGPAPRDAGWYRREAQGLARQGRYVEAMQAEFRALVLDLDQRRVLRFHPSKTPNEYTSEARLAGPSREAFRELVDALYGYAFARRPCGPEQFLAWHALAAAERYAAAE